MRILSVSFVTVDRKIVTVLLRNLGVHIAIAILRQLDTSDLVGRVVGLKDESQLNDPSIWIELIGLQLLLWR